uniref:Uncharacterized protein n=1 Tax=Romanomermis culicivorax TaxID=13658 RepID=A0A915HYM2_ROMCU
MCRNYALEALTDPTRCANEYVTMLNKKDFPTLVDKFYRDTSKMLPPDGTVLVGKTEALTGLHRLACVLRLSTYFIIIYIYCVRRPSLLINLHMT